MTSSNDIGPWDVVLVHYPFSDMGLSKKRPGLVLHQASSKQFGALCVIAMITSNIESEELVGDLILKDWQPSGLMLPSRLRLSILATIKMSLIAKKLGQLTAPDRKRAAMIFRKTYLTFSSYSANT
jgi:hypothetical protein